MIGYRVFTFVSLLLVVSNAQITDNGYLSEFVILDCYGTTFGQGDHTTSVDEETPANRAGHTQQQRVDDVTGVATIDSTTAGDLQPTVAHWGDATKVGDTYPRGRILYVDAEVERPCFFRIRYKGKETAPNTYTDHEMATANMGMTIAMAIDHANDASYRLIHDGTVAGTQPALFTAAGVEVGNGDHTMWTAQKNKCDADTTNKNACAIVHTLTLDQDDGLSGVGNDVGLQTDADNADGYKVAGFKRFCATQFAELATARGVYQIGATHGAEFANAWINALPTADSRRIGEDTNYLSHMSDLWSYKQLTTGDAAIETNTNLGSNHKNNSHNFGTCSTVLIAQTAEDYKDPTKVSLSPDTVATNPPGTNAKIVHNEYLYWQAHFSWDHVAITPRRMNIVLGENTAAVHNSASYITWAKEANASADYINDSAYAIWIAEMPSLKTEIAAAMSNDSLNAFTDRITKSNCTDDNCPITIEDDDSGESWLGVKITIPNVTIALGGSVTADDITAFNAALTKPIYAVLGNSAVKNVTANWFGGLTRLPGSLCTNNSSCAMSIYHGVQDRTPVVGNATHRYVCSKLTDAAEAESCYLAFCMWPSYKCVKINDENDDYTINAMLGNDKTQTQSDPRVWEIMNGQGDGDLATSDSESINANVLHVKKDESKAIHVKVTSQNSDYPIVIRRLVTTKTESDTTNFTGIRPTMDWLNPGISGTVDTFYPMTAGSLDTASIRVSCLPWQSDKDVSDITGTVITTGTGALDSGANLGIQYGCGRMYHIPGHAADGNGEIALGNYADPNIHEWKLNNLKVVWGDNDSFDVMTYNFQFTNVDGFWTASTDEVYHQWYIYGQTVNSDDTFLADGEVAIESKPRFVKLYETIREYNEAVDDEKLIIGLQLGNDGASANTNDDKWRTGTDVRTLIADGSRGSSQAGELAMSEYTFTNHIQFGFHLETGSLIKAGAKIFMVNTSLYAEDSPKFNGYEGVKGKCSAPVWANVTANNTFNATRASANGDGSIDIANVDNDSCAGLSDPTPTATRCFEVELSSTDRSLLRGEYALYVQNTPKSFFTKQSNSKATFTIKAYEHSDSSYIHSNSVSIGGGAADSNPTYEWEYQVTDVRLKYKQTDARPDQYGFVLVHEDLPKVYDIKSKFKVTDVLAGGKFENLIKSKCIYDNQNITTHLATIQAGVNVVDCINIYGTGSYNIFVQILGSEEYVKQNSKFTVGFKSDYEESEADIISKIQWKNATKVADADGTEQYLFDETTRQICDVNAEKGEKLESSYDGINDKNSMQLTFTAGSAEMNATDECYIQIFDEESKPVDTWNGVSPATLKDVLHPYATYQDADDVTQMLALSSKCQNAPANLTATNVSNSSKTGSTNYYQIPKSVVAQFRPGYSLRLWVRRANKQWKLQGSNDTRLTIQGYSTTSPTGLVTEVLGPELADGTIGKLESPKNGETITYRVTSKAGALANSNDIVKICVKPATYGQGLDNKNFFFRDFDANTVFCYNGDLDAGALVTHEIKFVDASNNGMPPGLYDVYTNYDDNGSSSEAIDACSKWSKESTQLKIDWARDTSLTEAHVWSSGGASVNLVDSTVVKAAAITNKIGTEGPNGKVDPTDQPDKITIFQPKDTVSQFEQWYEYEIRYPNTVWETEDYYLYWSMATTNLCDCVDSLCTEMTHIDVGYVGWPNVGRPNCQEHNKPYRTLFPTSGKYQLCATKNANLRGWPLQANIDQVRTDITLEINPEAASPGPSPTSGPAVSPSSTVMTAFACAIALVGALML